MKSSEEKAAQEKLLVEKIALLEDKLNDYSIICNHIDVGIIIGSLDENSIIEYINERALQMIGYTREQYHKELKDTIAYLTLLDDIESVKKNIDILKRTGEPVRFKVRANRRDGKIVWLMGTGVVIQNQLGRKSALYTFRDSTEWQLMEDELARQESLMDNIMGGVELCEYTEGFPIAYVNNGFLSMIGYTRSEIKSLFHNLHMGILYPPDLDITLNSIMLQVKEKQRYSCEYRIQRKDGKIIWVLDRGMLISTETESPLIQSILTDITVQKETQEALRISEKRYALVMNFSDVTVFDYDIITGQMIHHRLDISEYNFPVVMENAVQTLVQTGVILPESIDTFQELYRKIHAGEPSAEAIIYTKDPNEDNKVILLQLTTIYDDYGKPVRAVGVKKDITETFSLKREKEYGDTMLLSKQFAYEANVTQDKISNYNDLWLKELNLSLLRPDSMGSMTQVIMVICENAVAPEYRALFLKKSSQEYIINMFELGKRLFTFEYLKKTGENSYQWFEKTVNIIKDEASGDINIRCYITSVGERKKKEAQLQVGTQHYEAMLSKSIAIFDVNLTKNLVVFGHEILEKLCGIEITSCYSDMMDSLCKKAIHPQDESEFYQIYNLKHVLASYANGNKELICEYRWPDENNEFIWVRSTMHLFQDPITEEIKGLSYIENIDDEKKKRLDLIYKSQHDLLTDFYNKVTVAEKINSFLSTREGKAGRHAFFIIDLDYFKLINDNFGHAFGDAVLLQVSGKVKALFRDDDILGRIGGDEFIIFMKNAQLEKTVALKAEEICASVIETYIQSGRDFRVSASIGIAFYDENSKNYTELYHHSDTALYHAKQCGRNRYSIYSPDLSTTDTAVSNINLNRLVQTKYFGDSISEYVFRILYESPNKIFAINSALEMVAKRYNACRAYIFEGFSSSGEYMRNTFEWCSKDIQPCIDKLQKVSYRDLGDYRANFINDDIFYLPKVDLASKISKAILQPASIQSMVQFAIIKNSMFCGFIGFEQCESSQPITASTRNDYRNVASILSVFIMEMRAAEEIHKEKQLVLSIVNALGSYTYVCNPETYELLFATNHALESSPNAKIGAFCYAALQGRTTPCAICPISKLKESGLTTCTTSLTNFALGTHVYATSSWINWLGDRKACLIDNTTVKPSNI